MTVLVMMISDRVDWVIAACSSCRGKSALHRARNRGNLGTGQPVGQGHRNIPPFGVRVKWWCKRPPAWTVMFTAGQPPSGARPNRNELLREGRLLVSLDFQVGCTEVHREVYPRQIITSAKGREEALRGVNRIFRQTECGLLAGLGIYTVKFNQTR